MNLKQQQHQYQEMIEAAAIYKNLLNLLKDDESFIEFLNQDFT
jgi:hypothetical protein